MMTWILTVLVSLALGVAAYFVAGSSSSSPKPALVEKRSDAEGVKIQPSESTAVATRDDVEGEPSLVKLYRHLVGLDAAGLAQFVDRLNSLERRTPWQITMREKAFGMLGEKDPVAALARLDSHSEEANERREVVKDLFAKLVKVDLQLARELLEELGDEKLMRVAENIIAVEWLKTDRDAALAWLKELRGEQGFEENWLAFLKVWGDDDPQAALREIAASDRDDKKKLRDGVLKDWIGTDPDGAIVWIEADFGDDSEVWNDFWMGDSSKAFLDSTGVGHFDLLLRHPMNFERFQQSKMSSFISRLASRDPEAARARYEAADEKTRKSMASGLAEALASTHPEEAVKLFNSGDPDAFRGNQLNEVLDHYMLKNPKAAAAWWEALPASDRTSVFLNNIRDPDAFPKAAAFGSALANPEENVKFFTVLAKRWQEADPAGAMEWAKTLPEGSLRNEAMLGAFKSLAKSDPEAAFATAAVATDVGSRGRMMAEAATQWAAIDPEAAVLHSAQLEGASGLRALDAAIEKAAAAEPVALAELIASEGDSIGNIDHVKTYESIGLHWAGRDLDGALEWARSLPEGDSRDASLAGAAITLATYDPGAARQILDQLPPSDGRDASFQSGSQGLAEIDPASAFDWALEIGDPNMQLESLTLAVKQWSKFDPEAASGAIDAQRLDPQVLSKLRESLTE